MKRRLMMLLLASLAGAVGAHEIPRAHVPLAPIGPFVPLYESYDSTYLDFFYTIDPSHHQIAQNIGYVATPEPAAYLERTNQQRPSVLKKFRRFYKDYPEYNHFYTHDDEEARIVLEDLDYVEEQSEGYIYTEPMPGTVPFHRFNMWNPQTGDQQHYYSIDSRRIAELTNGGWTYDGIAGYVFPNANGIFAGGAIVGLRCPHDGTNAATCWGPIQANGTATPRPATYRDHYTPIRKFPTYKAPGKTRQVITFEFWSPDYFGTSTDHIAFIAHGDMNAYAHDVPYLCPGAASLECTWQRGLGMILYQQPSSVFFGESNKKHFGGEAWWVNAPYAKVSGPDLEVASAFTNYTRYSATLIVSDGGSMNAKIFRAGQLVASKQWNTQGAGVYPATSGQNSFPVELTNLVLTSANDAQKDYTFYIENLSIRWE